MQDKFRMVASDVDGTLVDAQGNLTSRTRRVLEAVHRLEVEVTLVTGLNPWMARRYRDAIGPWVRIVCLNGVFIVENGRVMPGHFVDPDVAEVAIALMVEQGYVPLVYGADQTTRYLPRHREGMVEVAHLIAERPFQPYVAVDRAGELLTVTPTQLGVCDTPERTAALYPVLREALGDRAYIVHQPSGRTWVEVSHPEARKDTGLLTLANRLDIDPGDIVYFGDSLNDLPVFERLPHCVAVENALPEVKALAWRVAPPNTAEGVPRWLAQCFEVPFD